MPRWSVDIIRHRAEHLGTVVAPNEKEAIKTAIAIYDMELWYRDKGAIVRL